MQNYYSCVREIRIASSIDFIERKREYSSVQKAIYSMTRGIALHTCESHCVHARYAATPSLFVAFWSHFVASLQPSKSVHAVPDDRLCSKENWHVYGEKGHRHLYNENLGCRSTNYTYTYTCTCVLITCCPFNQSKTNSR